MPIRKGETTMHPDDVAAACDENTIGVVGILGSTFDGAYEDIAGMAKALDKLEMETGLYVPIHVDAASGGLFAPFVDPELVWDFRIERVQSINASGHKYGLVYPGVGWVLWRSEEARPEDLVFRVDYLGGDHPTMSLNFTKPGSGVVAQYYQFVRLGYEGFKRVHQHSRDIAKMMARAIDSMDEFELVDDASDLPVVAFCFKGANTKSGKPRKGSYAEKVSYTLSDVADWMKQGGWAVPAYPFCADREEMEIIRIVVRNAFSRDLAEMFLTELGSAGATAPARTPGGPSGTDPGAGRSRPARQTAQLVARSAVTSCSFDMLLRPRISAALARSSSCTRASLVQVPHGSASSVGLRGGGGGVTAVAGPPAPLPRVGVGRSRGAPVEGCG